MGGRAFARTFYVSGFYQRLLLLHRQRNRGGDYVLVGSLHLVRPSASARLLLPKLTGIGGGVRRCGGGRMGEPPRPRRRRRRRFQPQPRRQRRRRWRHVGTRSPRLGPARTLFQGEGDSRQPVGKHERERGLRSGREGGRRRVSPKSHGCPYMGTQTFTHEVALINISFCKINAIATAMQGLLVIQLKFRSNSTGPP